MPVIPGLCMPLTLFDHDLLPNLLNCCESGKLITFYSVFLQHAEPTSKKIQGSTTPAGNQEKTATPPLKLTR